MKVLITKKLSQENLDLIKSYGWNYEVVETLKITLIDVNEIPKGGDAWVVSSRNSFAAIKKFIVEAPREIFCVGEWMNEEIGKLTNQLRAKSFENMKSLAADLSKQRFKQIIYFCADEHRKDLEEGLKSTAISISKVITHKSEMTFPSVENNFDAVFVLSPRSAESLLKKNVFSLKTVFVCIGQTTAEYLRSRGISNIFISSYPESSILLNEFQTQILNLKS